MKNIYAHTGPTPKEGYVGYISVNQRESGIEVSVRSEGNPAPLGVITLSPEQCEHLATDLLAHINQEPPAKPDQQAQAGCDYCNNPMFAGFKCDNCGRKPEPQAQAGEPRPWDHINDALPVLVAAANGKWSWVENTECKYVELRIDMRDGGCIIKNRRDERITPEQLGKQPWGHGGIPWDSPPAICQEKLK